MPVVGCHNKPQRGPLTPSRISHAVMLTYERAGLLTATLESLMRASPDLHVVVYDDGSETPEKLAELDTVEASGIHVNRLGHRGLVRTWMEIFIALSAGVNTVYEEDAGIVLLEDDLLFASGWDQTMLRMAKGVERLGLKPGAMTCFRCHEEPQAKVYDLNGVQAYQSMQHGFQCNMVPAWVFDQAAFLEEAAQNSEKGDHGIDVWFIGGMAHRLGLTSFMSMESWVAHVGAGRSVAADQGYVSFKGVGYNLVHGLDVDSGQLF